MSEEMLKKTLDQGVLTLVINRPERRNAIRGDLCETLVSALNEAAVDPEVRAILLCGVGKDFSVGGDVQGMGGARAVVEFEEAVARLRQSMEASRLLHETLKPTVAMLRGAVAGAGLSLALACDFRIASTTIKMTTGFANVGLSGDYGGSYFLTRLVGTAKARELYFLPRVIGAAEALELGIVNNVFPDEEVEDRTLSFLARLASGPTVAIGHMKANMNVAEVGELADVLSSEALRHVRCNRTEDHKEAAAAFLAKRSAVFKGR